MNMGFDKIRVVRLSHVHYQHPDLDKALAFFSDFGLVQEGHRNGRVFLRGYGVQPYVHVAEQSPDGKRQFMGGYWVVESQKDLQRASDLPDASTVQDLQSPGGGQFVTVPDPNGMTVGFVYGQKLRETDKDTARLEKGERGKPSNTSMNKPRQGAFRRFEFGASPVHKLGHYGYIVPKAKFAESLQWYTNIMNLKPTDCVYDGKTGEDETCFLHIDQGAQYSDHHVS
jgi:catechol 2,3-dioxygenase-like lactoylglutathione lyase family enzyme